MKSTAAAILLAVAGVLPSATAHADCGDPGQDPCTGPVPTVDQVVGVLQDLTDPNVPAMNKDNVVTPGFTPDEAGTIDDHLNRMRAFVFGSLLPLNFVVTDIQPAPNNLAGATVWTTGGIRQRTLPTPIVLADQGGRWLLTHDAAMTEMKAIWNNADRVIPHT